MGYSVINWGRIIIFKWIPTTQRKINSKYIKNSFKLQTSKYSKEKRGVYFSDYVKGRVFIKKKQKHDYLISLYEN